MTSGYTFILAKWRNDAEDICAVREQVLGEAFGGRWEYGDAESEERAFHVLVYDSAGRAVGAARMQPDGCIDYVAVRRPWRGVTLGGALLSYLVHIAQARRLDSVWSVVPASAQTFFKRNHFVATGSEGDAGRKWVRRVPAPGQREDALQ
jgi:GNAT superfamily N-acetyltransferase